MCRQSCSAEKSVLRILASELLDYLVDGEREVQALPADRVLRGSYLSSLPTCFCCYVSLRQGSCSELDGVICQRDEGQELVELVLLKAFADLLLEPMLNAVLQRWHLEDLGGSKSAGVLAVGL